MESSGMGGATPVSIKQQELKITGNEKQIWCIGGFSLEEDKCLNSYLKKQNHQKAFSKKKIRVGI